jgi:hypothetical protein
MAFHKIAKFLSSMQVLTLNQITLRLRTLHTKVSPNFFQNIYKLKKKLIFAPTVQNICRFVYKMRYLLIVYLPFVTYRMIILEFLNNCVINFTYEVKFYIEMAEFKFELAYLIH